MRGSKLEPIGLPTVLPRPHTPVIPEKKVPTALQYPLERRRSLERRWQELLQQTRRTNRHAASDLARSSDGPAKLENDCEAPTGRQPRIEEFH
jgi:hypothetical protein